MALIAAQLESPGSTQPRFEWPGSIRVRVAHAAERILGIPCTVASSGAKTSETQGHAPTPAGDPEAVSLGNRSRIPTEGVTHGSPTRHRVGDPIRNNRQIRRLETVPAKVDLW